jgi:hypothetical protein
VPRLRHRTTLIAAQTIGSFAVVGSWNGVVFQPNSHRWEIALWRFSQVVENSHSCWVYLLAQSMRLYQVHPAVVQSSWKYIRRSLGARI